MNPDKPQSIIDNNIKNINNNSLKLSFNKTSKDVQSLKFIKIKGYRNKIKP